MKIKLNKVNVSQFLKKMIKKKNKSNHKKEESFIEE